MDRNVLAPSDKAIRSLAEKIAACAAGFNEGDVCELFIEMLTPATPEMRARIEDGVRGTGAELLGVSQGKEGVHIQVRVGILPLFAIALLSLGVLVPAGVVSWRLFRWGPQEMTSFLIPFALITVGTMAVIVSPRPVTFVFAAGLVGGGAYLALRKAPPVLEVRASITGFTWERPVTALPRSRQYAMAGRPK